MKYKVGDWIKVVKRFDPKADYYRNMPQVVEEMLEMQGGYYKILSLTRDGTFYIINYWSFSDEMIECRVHTFDNGKTFIPYNENMEMDEN